MPSQMKTSEPVTYSVACPACGSHDVHRKSPPPEPNAENYALGMFIVVIVVGCLIFRWPFQGELLPAALLIAAAVCAFIVHSAIGRRHRNKVARLPMRWVCRCGLEGDFEHFHKPLYGEIKGTTS